MNDEDAKEEIIRRFMTNVYGREPEVDGSNPNHDGRYGHWLETQMGITHNGDNEPDLFGYEMKNTTSSGKTTFGDWSPNIKVYGNDDNQISKADFTKIFGHPSSKHSRRWSYSGEPVPKINTWNKYGQIMVITKSLDICIVYDYSEDKRADKDSLVPERFRSGRHPILVWTHDYMKKRVESKFNQNGWFKCLIGEDGKYNSIVFGKPITYEDWVGLVRKGIVYFDPGLYYDEIKDNKRPYMQWRANNDYWDEMIVERYP